MVEESPSEVCNTPSAEHPQETEQEIESVPNVVEPQGSQKDHSVLSAAQSLLDKECSVSSSQVDEPVPVPPGGPSALTLNKTTPSGRFPSLDEG